MSIKLNLNEPLKLALLRTDPKEFQHEGRAPSYMYSVELEDGGQDKIFLTPAAHKTIQELQIKAHEWFSLVRRKTPQGTEYFEIETSRASGRSGIPASIAPTPKPVAAEHAPQPAAMPASNLMSRALIAAIDATDEAKRHAASRGLTIEFTSEDIRAIANTFYIQYCRTSAYRERDAA